MSDDQISPERPPVGGRYRLRRRIARGGMAEVFLADDEILGRPVAVKILASRLAADDNAIARFRNEAAAVAGLNHPNIVQVYDWGPHDGTFYIAMEYVDGPSLAQILAQSRPAPPEAARIGAEIASALHAAHVKGIIHRDIKPANILITEHQDQGQGPRVVKVTDFGIAKAVQSDANLTATGMIMGTAEYSSPEQAQGLVLGPASDLYSLGVVLFEMLTGRTPFIGANPLAVAHQHVKNQPPTVHSLNPSAPPEFDALVNGLLVKNPADRYQRADDLEVALRALARGQRPPARSGATPAEAQGVTTALPMSPGATNVMPAASARGGNAVAGAPSSNPDPGPGPRTPRTSGAFIAVLAAVILAAVAGLFYLAFNNSQAASDSPAPTDPPAVTASTGTTTRPPSTSGSTTAPPTSASTTTTAATSTTVAPTSNPPTSATDAPSTTTPSSDTQSSSTLAAPGPPATVAG